MFDLYNISHIWQAKGQLNSEWIYEVIVFPKKPTRNLKDFCPGSWLEGRAEILQILGWHFWRNDDLKSSFWIWMTSIFYAWYFMYRNCVELFSEVLKGPISMTCKSGFDIWTWEAIRKSNFCKKSGEQTISHIRLQNLFDLVFLIRFYSWCNLVSR